MEAEGDDIPTERLNRPCRLSFQAVTGTRIEMSGAARLEDFCLSHSSPLAPSRGAARRQRIRPNGPGHDRGPRVRAYLEGTREPLPLETSVPGLFAVGELRADCIETRRPV